MCESPYDLIEYVSRIKEVLRLHENDRNDYQLENNPNLYRRSIPGYIYLFNFIMNRVPTDMYRIRNPKLEIERDRNEFSQNREVFSIKQQAVIKDDNKGMEDWLIEEDNQSKEVAKWMR